MRIKVKIKKAKKSTRILALIALIGLVVTDIIGNIYASGMAVLFALALIAAVITDMVGGFIKSWRESREWLERTRMNENQVTIILLAVITIAVLFLLVSTAVGAAVVTERRLRKKDRK